MNKNTKQVQQRKAKAAPSYADDTNAASDAPKRWSDYTVQFEFPEPTELPPPLIQLNNVSFQYPGRDDFGLKDLNIGVDMGSRVAIVGPNGAGKTTLMNLLSGTVACYLAVIMHGFFHSVQQAEGWWWRGRGRYARALVFGVVPVPMRVSLFWALSIVYMQVTLRHPLGISGRATSCGLGGMRSTLWTPSALMKTQSSI